MEGNIENTNEIDGVLEEPAEGMPEIHDTTLMIVHPTVVYACTDMLIEVDLSCAEDCLEIEGSIRALGEQGEELATAPVIVGNEDHHSAALAIKAPKEPGQYSYQAIFDSPEESCHRSCATSFSFEVREHCIILSAWGIPSPVTFGEAFTVKIGARCPGNCSLAGTVISVTDEEGEQIAQASLEDKVLAGTSGTYFTELELPAPQHEGTYVWKACCVSSEAEYAHRMETVDLAFRTAAPPEYRVSVNVVKARDIVPLETANVMLGLRRTFTDEQGIAILEVPGGKQILRVSKQDYRSYEEEIEINANAELTIELVYDPTL